MQLPDSKPRCWLRVAMIFISASFLSATVLAEQPLPDVKRLQTSPVLQHLKPNPMPLPPRTPAEQTVAQMYLPEGFRAELVAAEPDLHQPVAFAFDERGRIWVAEAYSYPQKRPPGEGLDKIVIFEDRDGDGQFESRKVFAEGLNLVSGLEVGYGGVWVGAAPELLFIPDRNHDDVPDGPPQALLDGFGYQDTHECLNSFLWGPDGWLYGNQGVFNTAHIGKPGSSETERVELRAGVWRYHPVRHKFEVFAHGGSNQWGLDFDERGQLFMTHCRSYWGRGCTTHVIQGGHYWNQANANYAPFIVANPPEDFPGFRNFLLASARYDHGAGGAGKPGSDAIYGGHSHVGTMIYLGDNWPDEFRGHLFTHNLGGHQINHQVNNRLGSGFETVHAGRDQFFCSDPKYVAVDLQYGPDGAVYTIDWYDQQHCHNPNTERWDRSNGRIYRIEFESTYKPRKVDLGQLDDLELAKLQTHKNEWFARTSRRLLHERALERRIDQSAKDTLNTLANHVEDSAHCLRAMWTLHAIGEFARVRGKIMLDVPNADTPFTRPRLGPGPKNTDEYIRAWTVQLLAESGNVAPEFLEDFVKLAKWDRSPVVRLYLASAIPRLPEEKAWQIIEALAQHGEDRDDRNLPLLIWQGLAQRMSFSGVRPSPGAETPKPDVPSEPSTASRRAVVAAPGDGRTPLNRFPRGEGLSARGFNENSSADRFTPRKLDRAFAIAKETKIPQLADYIYWYAATFEGEALNRVVESLGTIDEDSLRCRLAGMELAMNARAKVAMPVAWKTSAAKLYASNDPRVLRQTERLAAVFGDDSMFARMRETLANANADADARRHAFTVLSRAQDPATLPVFVNLLDDGMFRSRVIPLLARFDMPQISDAMLARLETFSTIDRSAALNALTGRASFALALLDAVTAGRLKRDQLTAFHIRQLTELHHAEVDKRVAATWGKIHQSPAEKQTQITRMEKVFNEAPLWAYDAGAGRQHFQKLCAQCHRLGNDGIRLGPELTGAGKNGIRYYLENIIDPNAVIGTDFQMTTVETKKGDVISGLIINETPNTLTLRTTADQVAIEKAVIMKRNTSEQSMMPEGLIESLKDREQIELLKFLTSN